MTEYQPYGVRHFLRRLDAEGASELRRHLVALRGGGSLDKGAYADRQRPGKSPEHVEKSAQKRRDGDADDAQSHF